MPWSRISPDCQEPPFLGTDEGQRSLTWAEATREALIQAMELDPSVFIMGQGVDDPMGMFGTTRDLHKRFGPERVFDTPLAETALTGIAVGAAQAGMRPVYFHNRPDFLCLAMDQLVNHASKWAFMFAGQVPVPMVVWACIGRGWGGAAQHSQALQGLFTHVPGLKLCMPATCYDAKGLLLAGIKDNNPVLIIDHRYNFKSRGIVPEKPYTVPIGQGTVRRPGQDVTLVATSHLVMEAWYAAEELAKEGIDVEIFDPRTLNPLDIDGILRSLQKTGRLVVTDTGWKTCGITAEIAALAAGPGFGLLRAPVVRVTAPDLPVPAGHTLEADYYFDKDALAEAVREVCS